MSCNSRCSKVCDENGTLVCRSTSAFKLDVYDWMEDIPQGAVVSDVVEIRFKNTRKAFYYNVNQILLKQGDIVAVEASPGHDIGIVSMVGNLVDEQLKKSGIDKKQAEFKKIYRKAKQNDVDRWVEAMNLELTTMIRARKITNDLKLEMKIGDVEYQGDRTKAIFYYIADERVDFRELIKVLADEFKVRIEMRQIGARQEAGRIGGIGSCGREICCSTWMTSFSSVTTASARYQELALNPQKLAGQCGKLKCCLNYELDVYIDARRGFPDTETPLETKEGIVYHQKTDIFKGLMWYSYEKDAAVNLTPVPVERVKEIMALNKKNQRVDKLLEIDNTPVVQSFDYRNALDQEDLTRFDAKNKKKKRKKKRPRDNRTNNNA